MPQAPQVLQVAQLPQVPRNPQDAQNSLVPARLREYRYQRKLVMLITQLNSEITNIVTILTNNAPKLPADVGTQLDRTRNDLTAQLFKFLNIGLQLPFQVLNKNPEQVNYIDLINTAFINIQRLLQNLVTEIKSILGRNQNENVTDILAICDIILRQMATEIVNYLAILQSPLQP